MTLIPYSTEQEHVTFQAIIHHISEASDACGRYGHMKEDNRWLAVANLLLETRERLYKLAEEAIVRQ